MPLAALFPDRPLPAVLAVCLCTVSSSLALCPFKISPQDLCTCHPPPTWDPLSSATPMAGPSSFSRSHFTCHFSKRSSARTLSQENPSPTAYSSQPFEHELHPGGDHVYICVCVVHCCFFCTWPQAWPITGTQQTHPAE